jgi:hypothetical protein
MLLYKILKELVYYNNLFITKFILEQNYYKRSLYYYYDIKEIIKLIKLY